MAEEDRRAQKYRFAGLLVPLLAVCCGVIALLVVLGLVDLLYSTLTHHRLFAGGPATVASSPAPADPAASSTASQ
jgi:hypothetical protein